MPERDVQLARLGVGLRYEAEELEHRRARVNELAELADGLELWETARSLRDYAEEIQAVVFAMRSHTTYGPRREAGDMRPRLRATLGELPTRDRPPRA